MLLAIKIHPFFDVLKTRFLFRAFLFIVRLMMTRNNCQFTEFLILNSPSLYGNRFGQVPGLVNISSLEYCHVVGK